MQQNMLMKKTITHFSILTSSILFSSSLFAEQMQSPKTAVSALNTAIVVKNLDYKTIFMQFHQKDIRYLKMKDISMDQAVGLKGKDGNIDYAVFNPVQTYQNVQGEKRFIVRLEMFEQDDGLIITGHPSRPKVELYLFKQLSNGQYQLLSQSRPDLDISGSWGESHLTAEDFQKIRRVGKAQMGLIYSGGYTSTGSHSEFSSLIVLNERGWIEEYPFGISEDNSGAYEHGDPKLAGFSKVYQLKVDPTAPNLYPIQVTYSSFGKMDWRDDLPKNGSIFTIQFNEKKNCYINQKGKCNTDFDD
ncbi:hypothetical protein [Acinetobacter rongchengensis]|uniref:Uncharacterized protein n=1 Tax=Acinetobacter rongchengensis TaxID=2419601 RepID=A0A3A8EPS7_9GAMM|nr:hypothetical protein [Acinetobacter rongchengensis]RKG36555.1 hypothetical protein D7V20_14505 [Acinetobacter rongchengensis]